MSKNKISPHYPLFEHMSIEHDLTLTESELQEIINVVRSFDAQTQELIEQNAELVEMLEYIFYKTNFQNHFPTTSIKVKNLLTKYNSLKSNTNETDMLSK